MWEWVKQFDGTFADLRQTDKLHVLNNFYIYHNVFKSQLLQMHQSASTACDTTFENIVSHGEMVQNEKFLLMPHNREKSGSDQHMLTHFDVHKIYILYEEDQI